MQTPSVPKGEKRGPWLRTATRIAHKNPWYEVREDTVVRPDGTDGVYFVVQSPDAVIIVPVDDQRNVYLIKMYRYTINRESIEVPAGSTDGEDPLIAAKRELMEEASLTAAHWKHLGVVYPANGRVQEKNHVYLATELTKTNQNSQLDEGISEVIGVPFTEALAMIRRGEICDTQCVTALTIAAFELGILNA